MKVFATLNNARDACQAHVPECKCAAAPDEHHASGFVYFILMPDGENTNGWDVIGHGPTEWDAWEDAFTGYFI